jgi:hypothetical protein
MESFIFLSLLFAYLASGAVIERRQAGGLGSLITQLKGSNMSPHSTIDISPRVKQNAKRQQVRYGPFVLPPQKV